MWKKASSCAQPTLRAAACVNVSFCSPAAPAPSSTPSRGESLAYRYQDNLSPVHVTTQNNNSSLVKCISTSWVIFEFLKTVVITLETLKLNERACAMHIFFISVLL